MDNECIENSKTRIRISKTRSRNFHLKKINNTHFLGRKIQIGIIFFFYLIFENIRNVFSNKLMRERFDVYLHVSSKKGTFFLKKCNNQPQTYMKHNH